MKVPKRPIVFAFLVLTSILCSGQTPAKIRVIADYADIRSRPAIDAEVLDVASKGETFAVEEKSGAWYKIKLSDNKSGQVSYGYLHESMVAPAEVVEGQKEAPETPKKPAPVSRPGAEQPPAPSQETAPSQTLQKPGVLPRNFFAGTFLKLGFGEDRWIASIGNDFGIERNFALGFELQPYYKDYSEQNLTVLEMSIFANAKAGFKYSSFSLFGGGGIGPDLYYTNAEINGESESRLDTRLAYHFLAGAAVIIHSVALVFEFQAILVSDPLVDPDPWKYYFLFGLRF